MSLRLSPGTGGGSRSARPPRLSRRGFLGGAAGLLGAAGDGRAGAAADLSPGAAEELVRAAVETMREQSIPGLSLALARAGRIVFSQGFGLADLENRVPASAITAYRLASISKPFTAVALLQLVEEGKLDLDAPIQRYAPAYPPKRWTLTARHLLGHLGGVRHYRRGEIDSTRRYESLTEALALFRDDPLEHEPGTRYLYTTYGYNLLGCAVEGASGERFLDRLRARIFVPAGLTALRDDDQGALIPHRAQGYRKLPGGELRNSFLADVSNKIPGGGLCGTAEDLARFGLAVLGDRLVRPETRAQMFTSGRTSDGRETGYGLGWTLSPDGRETGHGGGQPRVSTLLRLRPSAGLVVGIMSNLEGARLAGLADRALALAAG